MKKFTLKKSPLPAVIKDRRIVLRRHSPKTAAEIFACVDRDRARLGRFLPWVKMTKTVVDTLSFISMCHEKWKTREAFNYAIFSATDNTFIGTVGFFHIQWEHGCGEIGYWIAKEFEGQGLMSDAVRALESAAFKKGFHRLEIRCDSDNKKSAAVPKRLGYHLDGRLVQDRRNARGWRDTLIFGKVKRA